MGNQNGSLADIVLDVKSLSMDFGGLRAVDSVDLRLHRGEIAALIGPNGAGKTTFFNCITGIYKPTQGEILIHPQPGKTERIERLNAVRITTRGLARTFQNIRLFQNMTVLENVMVGRDCRLSSGILGAIFRFPGTKSEEEQVIYDSYEILKKIGLEAFSNELAKNLPYGAQRRLEIARALATEPFILLLDEPAAGMNPMETRALNELIVRLRETEKLSILIIEHDMSLVMSLSENIFVMDYGKLIATGIPEEIKNNQQVIKAYLGADFHA